MKTFDMHHDIEVSQCLADTDISSATTTNGAIIDTAGFESLEVLHHFGAIAASAGITLQFEHGNESNLSDATVVSAEETLGQTTVADSDDNNVAKLGYIGKERYVRANIITAGTQAVNVRSVYILGTPHHAPTSDAPN